MDGKNDHFRNPTQETKSNRVSKLEKTVAIYVDNLFDNKSFSNMLLRSYKSFYTTDDIDFKKNASRITSDIKSEVKQRVDEAVEKMELKSQLQKLDNLPLSDNISGWQPTGEPDVDVKAFRYAAKLNFLQEKESSVIAEYEQLQKEKEQQLRLYQQKKEKLMKVAERRRLQVEEYDEYHAKLETVLSLDTNCTESLR